MSTKKGAKAKTKGKGAAVGTAQPDDAPHESSEPLAAPQEAQLERLLQKLAASGVTEGKKAHTFWDTQPMPRLEEAVDPEMTGPMEPEDKEVRQELIHLPSEFEWFNFDVDNDEEIQEIYTLLFENYVEDDDNMFRFNYSKEFLRWALKPPGFRRDWHIGVRVTKNHKLVGVITGIPAIISIHKRELQLVEINFLCVHKKLRGKRLAPVMIREVTRRCNLVGVRQAVYTAGVILPKPVARCRYWHRSLNPRKLIDVGFSRLPPRQTMSMVQKLYRVPEEPQTPGIRPMELRDVPQVTLLLAEYTKRFTLHPVFSEEEVAHWLVPVPDIINTYVVEDPTSHEITDFFSFYTLPSTVLGNKHHQSIKAAYMFYCVPGKTAITPLMSDALVLAKMEGYDVFNALDIFQNQEFLETLKFGVGDGNLQYYIFNFRCPDMPASDVGLVML